MAAAVSPCSYLDCRSHTTSVSYSSKNGGKVLTYLAGYSVDTRPNPNPYSYEGITL